MNQATHDDIVRLLPGVQDHTAVEILATNASAADLETALLLLQDDDEALIAAKHNTGSRLNQLLEILERSELEPPDDRDV